MRPPGSITLELAAISFWACTKNQRWMLNKVSLSLPSFAFASYLKYPSHRRGVCLAEQIDVSPIAQE